MIPAGKALRLRMPALKKGTYNFVGDFNQSTAKAGSSRSNAHGATFVVTLREASSVADPRIVYAYLDRMGGRRYYGT